MPEPGVVEGALDHGRRRVGEEKPTHGAGVGQYSGALDVDV